MREEKRETKASKIGCTVSENSKRKTTIEKHNMKFSKIQTPVPTSKEKKICTTPSTRTLSVPSSHRKMVSEVVASRVAERQNERCCNSDVASYVPVLRGFPSFPTLTSEPRTSLSLSLGFSFRNYDNSFIPCYWTIKNATTNHVSLDTSEEKRRRIDNAKQLNLQAKIISSSFAQPPRDMPVTSSSAFSLSIPYHPAGSLALNKP